MGQGDYIRSLTYWISIHRDSKTGFVKVTYAAEIVLLILNGVILILAYFLIHPRTVGNNISKLMQNDFLAIAKSLIVAGFLFWGTDHQFDLLVGVVNWVLFSVVIFLMMEVPFALWYPKKFDVDI